MQTPYPIITPPNRNRNPLIAPGSFRRAALYRFKGMKSGAKRPARSRLVREHVFGAMGRKAPATNILFRYLYRDASNYKQHGEAIFSNRTFLSLDEIEKQIRACLKDGQFFIARQVHIEERFFDALHDDDHPWHEFEGVAVTTLAPFDPDNWAMKQQRRDISEFIADLERASQAGWDEMNVRADLQRLLELQKRSGFF